MNDAYFDNTLSMLDQILRRKYVVQEQLSLLGCDCKKAPNVPGCLLQTELGLLTQIADTLERELWHAQHSIDPLAATSERR